MKLIVGILLFCILGLNSILAQESGCFCKADTCGCCEHIVLKVLGINDSVCLDITYIPSEVGLSLTLWLDKLVLLNETVSLEDPDICLPIPVIDNLADVCVKFYNMNITETQVKGCVELEFTLIDVDVGDFPLGCFDIDIPTGKKIISK
eukprot:TRINITY_DN1656_c0_g1_i2.p1 TRINITY_DN1656_c0_g1~~TRINITY_DN1656_c0_g1_i2.p1  ORF type:complete len:149 (-),score=11.31 TRINITY_DN1656_c0_g1_i2:28-474(-)